MSDSHRAINTLIVVFLTACSASPKQSDIASVEGSYTLKQPEQRANDRTRYFTEEFRRIQERRAQYGFATIGGQATPDRLVGLALSGGGIRSNAYHLGVLSGLNGVSYLSYTLLNRIDYLSSVSGGSWAAGGYWAYAGSDQELFDCLDNDVKDHPQELGAQCKVVAALLRDDQGTAASSKNAWTKAILDSHLLGKDYDLVLGPLPPHAPERPLPVFNSSHNVVGEEESAKNLPFQITPIEFGTIADCTSMASEDRCSEVKGGAFFFLSSNDLQISCHHCFDPEESGLRLSQAMHASSAVVNWLLGIKMRVRTNHDEKILGARDEYRLSDGGKSDNLGLASLIERGPQLIIVSDMAADPKLSFKDLETSSQQASSLLRRRLDQGAIIAGIRDGKRSVWSAYSDSLGKEEGKIFYVKPGTENIDDFREWLAAPNQDGRYREVRMYLQGRSDDAEDTIVPHYENADDFQKEKAIYEGLDNKPHLLRKHFPQTATFKSSYKHDLIRAYYLLGRYVALHDIAPALCEWLQSSKVDAPGSEHPLTNRPYGSAIVHGECASR